MSNYDFLIVGSGLFGAVFAECVQSKGKRCLVVEKRGHIGGNIYTEEIEGIQVHRYGAHIFHTGSQRTWDYVNRFASFNHYVNSPLANYEGRLFNLPFNMHTFYQMWGTVTPAEAEEKLKQQRGEYQDVQPTNLEEMALKLVGRDLYEMLVKGYTEKQWGRPCHELPPFIITRLPVRFTYNNNYFNDPFQGIPKGGYTRMVEQMLGEAKVILGTDYLEHRNDFSGIAKQVVFTGPIDAYYDHKFGPLQYRSLRFETETLDSGNYQGNAVINYTDRNTPFTRMIEHKHFDFGTQEKTVVTREYSLEWEPGSEPYYPVLDAANTELYEKYRNLAQQNKNVLFAGRLGTYQYLNMDQVVEQAMDLAGQACDGTVGARG